MSTNDQEEHEPLSEEQRLTLLEKTVSLNKIVIIGIGLILVTAISVILTLTIVSGLSEKPQDNSEQVTLLTAQLAEMESKLLDYEVRLGKMERSYPALRETLNNSSAPVMQKLMVNQEAAFQEFLKALKSGMYDLAHMVPGSRTWLELYNEQIDRALQLSISRQREMTKMQTGKPLIEPGS